MTLRRSIVVLASSASIALVHLVLVRAMAEGHVAHVLLGAGNGPPPVGAALLAVLYLRNQRQVPETTFAVPATSKPETNRPGLAVQIKFGLFALTVLLAAGRLLSGPVEPAVKLMLFGIADVLAFQVIHFEVVRRSYRDPVQGIGLAVVLFGLSWGIRDLLMTALGPSQASPAS